MILQKNNMPNYRILQVKKNRFDGEVGEVSMLFNPENKRYFEITADEKNQMLQSHGNFKKILKQRIEKYGTVEPEKKEDQLAMKIVQSQESKDKKAIGTKMMIKQDLEYFEKLR
jgi:hypothetical protein